MSITELLLGVRGFNYTHPFNPLKTRMVGVILMIL